MIKNGKYFVAPQQEDGDFKAVFKRLAAAGAGRPVDKDGFPEGPWTPDLLATAITKIAKNKSGVELRTVQTWFQDNDRAISTENIRWLARIFGCNDPEATSEWQAALTAATALTVARRREKRKTPADPANAQVEQNEAASNTAPAASEDTKRLSLAARSEAFFSRPSPLDLPATVFAGAVALGFFSYLTGIHNIFYERTDGITKQVGFIWAPNWTFLFMLFMPLFFAFAGELVAFWRSEGRASLVGEGDMRKSQAAWMRVVEASSYTYWAVFVICLAFAGLFQWIGVRLIPLLRGGGDYAIDWGSLAIVRPEVISVPVAATFTGFAYLYMCLTFYLLFVGLILLYTVAHDLWQIGSDIRSKDELDIDDELNTAGLRVMRAIFRCTVCGVLIAMCMKLQSFYLTSTGENVYAWLISDFRSVVYGGEDAINDLNYSMPTHYTSLLVAISACVVFVYGSARLGFGSRFHGPLGTMTAVLVLVVTAYIMIGAFPGFSILLLFGVLFAIYGLFDPGFGVWNSSQAEETPGVS